MSSEQDKRTRAVLDSADGEPGSGPSGEGTARPGNGCAVTTLDLRARRLEFLARQVAEGSYRVDPKELARALLEKEPELFRSSGGR